MKTLMKIMILTISTFALNASLIAHADDCGKSSGKPDKVLDQAPQAQKDSPDAKKAAANAGATQSPQSGN